MTELANTRHEVYQQLNDLFSLFIKEVLSVYLSLPLRIFTYVCMYVCLHVQGVEPIGLSDSYRRALPSQQVHYGDV